MRDPQPGGTLIAQQIASTMLVEALRLHLAGVMSTSGWLAALADTRLRPALACMHGEPARAGRWQKWPTQQECRGQPFAQRFRAKVGRTPMDYLAHWRMAIAAKLLNDGRSVSSVASAVGYRSESAFSAAFK